VRSVCAKLLKYLGGFAYWYSSIRHILLRRFTTETGLAATYYFGDLQVYPGHTCIHRITFKYLYKITLLAVSLKSWRGSIAFATFTASAILVADSGARMQTTK
jgi:hypothetical protein